MVGWVLWDMTHCRLFNSKSSSYTYIRCIIFGLVGFYSISTFVGYLMPNPFYTKYIWWGKVGFMAYQPFYSLKPNPFVQIY